MRADVVELAQGLGQGGHVLLQERDVGQPELRRGGTREADRLAGEVAADEMGVGQRCCHRQQVGAVAAADIEEAAGGHGRWREPEQGGHGGEVTRMG